MIETICICGAGTMGLGIAQLTASKGFNTILFDTNTTALQKAKATIESNLQLLVQKNKISTTQQQATIDKLQYTFNSNHCVAQLIIEAIVENILAKENLFQLLATINTPETILATNTSSLSVSTIAATIPHPARVVGMHFFNPAPIMPLIEIVQANETSEVVIATICKLALQLSKTPVVCKDAPGFIVNRVARPYYLEALRMVEAGHTDITTVDSLLEFTGFKMGPFKLMDLIGNDINYAVSSTIFEALHQPQRLAPSSLQKEKIAAGQLGKKTGKGFYNYT
jgi:3-hydroxybutyryl-CoA dehydrogenase